jgi:type IV pilus assembly protein PilA
MVVRSGRSSPASRENKEVSMHEPKGRRGFTLIESMVAVAILGILATLAVAQYQLYTTRAKISEGLILVAPVKMAVVEYHAVHGGLPEARNWLALLKTLGLNVDADTGAAAGPHVKRIWWNQAGREIRIRYGFAPVDDKVVYLRLDFTPSGHVIWTCIVPTGNEGVPARYLPSSCRS